MSIINWKWKAMQVRTNTHLNGKKTSISKRKHSSNKFKHNNNTNILDPFTNILDPFTNILDPRISIKPRKFVDIENKINENEPTSPKIKINDEEITNITMSNGRQRADTNKHKKKRQSFGCKKSNSKSPMDRAKFQLLQIYGTWFAAHVAALDFKDIPGDEVSQVVNNTLNNLNTSVGFENVGIIPDELIYKAALILCNFYGYRRDR